MKKILSCILMVSMIMALCLGLASCKLIFPDQTPVHTHAYVDGKCECGATDPNYVPPHQHSFVGGICECGEIDPNHECVFFEGKCIVCLKDDPNPNYVITGDYGVTAEIVGNCTVTVNTIDTKSDEYEDLSLTLQEGNVNILDKAWVMYNVTIEPEDEEGEVKLTTGKVSVPAPIPGVEEYLVYEVQETKVEEVEYELVNDYIVVNTWNYNYNYLVTTEQSFNVVEYYEKNPTSKIPEHINVGDETAEDAYEKGQTRTLEVYVCLDGNSIAYDEHIVHVNGLSWDSYNNAHKELNYQDLVRLYAVSTTSDHTRRFIGWYVGDFDAEGNIVLEAEPYSTELSFDFEMPAEDLKIFGVYAVISRLGVTGMASQVAFNGGEFFDYVGIDVHPLTKTVTLSVEPFYGYSFSHWAYNDDPYSEENFISSEPTFVYTIPEGKLRTIVAVCEPLPTYEFGFETKINGDNAYQIDFYVNGEYRGDNFYFADLCEGQTVTIKAEPIYGAHFLGWYAYSVDEDGVITPAGEVISTDLEYTFTMGTEEIHVLACFDTVPTACVDIWAELENLIYVNGELIDGPDYSINLEAGESLTVSTAANEGYTFLGWYSMDISGNETLYSTENTITYTVPEILEPISIYAKYKVTEYFKFSCWDSYSAFDFNINYNGIDTDNLMAEIFAEGTEFTLTITYIQENHVFLGWKDVYANEFLSSDLEYSFVLTEDTHIIPLCTEKRVDIKLVPFEDNEFVGYKYATDPTTGEKRIVGMISDGGKYVPVYFDDTKFLGAFYVMATLYNGTEEQIVNVPNNFEIIVDERLLPLDEYGFATIPGRGSYTISLVDRGNPDVRIDFVITKLDPAGTEYTADFGSFSESGVNDSHYADRTNDDGWTATNARCDKQAIDIFATSEQLTLNGITSNPGKLTSALIKDGSISSLTFKYGYAFNENRTISLTINIKNADGEIVATTTLTDTTVTQQVGESFTWTLAETYVGDFTIEIINNCPSGSSSTYKDRVSIADLYWYA